MRKWLWDKFVQLLEALDLASKDPKARKIIEMGNNYYEDTELYAGRNSHTAQVFHNKKKYAA